jgi:hypothetical protein
MKNQNQKFNNFKSIFMNEETVFTEEQIQKLEEKVEAFDFYDKNKSILGNFFHINFLFIHNCYHSC